MRKVATFCNLEKKSIFLAINTASFRSKANYILKLRMTFHYKIKNVNKLLFTFSRDSLFLNSTIADNVGVVVSSVTMIGPRLKRKKICLINTPYSFRLCVHSECCLQFLKNTPHTMLIIIIINLN